ncbi:MAG: protein kinase domain-containing protein [Gemmatimonadales bacterium]
MTDSFPRLAAALADRYTIERELGRGGMAAVYLARDLKHGRPVALKVLHPELAAALGPERFLREIEVAARLTHPHILPLHDSGSADGLLYYVMPFVEGESLRDRLTREQQLPLDDALQIARNVAAALGHAHSHGVIHRDIKPENILLEGGEAVVADFGIARAIGAAAGEKLTETGLAIGTAAYMSPEQAAGERDLDGRSDLYSLGCVLYEMLAGEPPFTGPTAQAIMAKRLSQPVPALHVVRETVPTHVEQAIVKALARLPADRFATAGQFGTALATGGTPTPGAESPPSRAVGRPSRALLVTIIGLIVATAAALVLRGRAAPKLDADLVAVAPFEVLDPSLELWREGIVDLLSRSLDGAGSLRTVSPSLYLRRWTGRSDAAAARALGRRTGAGLVVFGEVLAEGRDSVRLRATLLGPARGGPPQEVEIRGEASRMGSLTDSLSLALLRSLGSTRPVAAVRQSFLGATSSPALKEFLWGERFYRRSQWDSALTHYDRAIGLDSTFALPYHRMALSLGWTPTSTQAYASYEVYAFGAAARNHGLTPRDSLLVAADSFSWALYQATDSNYFRVRRRLFATLGEASRRFPSDPEVWVAVGEARSHLGGMDYSPAQWLDAFDRAIALDSGFTPAYEHTVNGALQLGRVDLARRYVESYLTQRPTDVHVGPLRLVAILMDPRRSNTPEATRAIDTASAVSLFRAGLEDLGLWPDSGEAAIRVLRHLATGNPSLVGAGWVGGPTIRHRTLASQLAKRGHLREARAAYSLFSGDPAFGWFLNPFLDLALLGAVPADSVTALYRVFLTGEPLRPPPTAPGLQPPQALAWWGARGDAVSLGRFSQRAATFARRTRDPLARLRLQYLVDAAKGYLLLAQADSAGALERFLVLPDSVCLITSCFFEKFTFFRLLAAQGRDREAAETLDRWLWDRVESPLFVLGTLERGRLAERLGERDKAIECYQYVVDSWRHADPELQPYVTEARTGLQRLTEETKH